MRQFIFSLAGAACLAWPHAAQATELEARSHIESVTLYPKDADVTRSADIELQQGASTLIFKALPLTIDVTSLRVTGEASEQLKIGGVEARLAASDAKTMDAVLETRLKTLRRDHDAWQATIDALELKREMIIRYSQASPEKLSPDAKPLELGQWTAAFDLIGSSLAKADDEIRAARIRVQEISEEINGLESNRTQPKGKPPTYDVSIALNAGASLKGKLLLTYRVAGAGWKPVYDARLTMAAQQGKPTLELIRRAVITQQTGEEWSDVALTISTVPTAHGVAAPYLNPEVIEYKETVEERRAANIRHLELPPALPRRPPLMSAEQDIATVQSTSYQAVFDLPGHISIPSDGAQKNFFLASHEYKPALTLKSSPALDPAAYLEAQFINQEDAPLLPGEVNILRDGAFIGSGKIDYIAPNDEIHLGLGADSKIKISRLLMKRKENNANSPSQTKFETWDIKTSVRNLHEFPVHLTMMDRAPYSDNTAIVVDILAVTPQPLENGPDAKLGVKTWSVEMGPLEQKEFRVAYRIKWPGGRKIMITDAPASAMK